MKLFNIVYKELSDEELMQLVRKGKKAAFEEIYARYNQKLFFFLVRMLNSDKEKARDILQDVFLKIIERPELFNTDKKFSTWVYTVAANKCRNEYRRLNIRQIVDKDVDLDNLEGNAFRIYSKIDSSDFRIKLYKELDNLNINQKTTFLLRFEEGLQIAEIAEIMECSEGTVKSRLFYTVKKLAEKFKVFDPNYTEKI